MRLVLYFETHHNKSYGVINTCIYTFSLAAFLFFVLTEIKLRQIAKNPDYLFLKKKRKKNATLLAFFRVLVSVNSNAWFGTGTSCPRAMANY